MMARGGAILQVLGLAVWVGGIVFMVWGVAGANFAVLPSRDLAGSLTGRTLLALNRLEGWCAVMVALGLVLEWTSGAARPRLALRMAVLGGMVALWAGYTFGVTPAMEALRPAIASFDVPAAEDFSPARIRFGELHRYYAGMMSLTCILGVVVLSLHAWEPGPRPGAEY